MRKHRFFISVVVVVFVAIGAAYGSVRVVDVVQARADQPRTCGPTALTGTPFRTRCGYFTNTLLSTSGSNSYILQEGIYRTETVARTFTKADKEDYISKISSYLGAGVAERDQRGAAFIIQTMRGNSGGADWNTDKPPTAAQIDDWKARIMSDDITVSLEPYTYGKWIAQWRIDARGSKYGSDDAFVYGGTGLGPATQMSVVFRSASKGGIVYAQRTLCANTYGEPMSAGGLPAAPKDYTLTPTLTTTPAVSEVGATVSLTPSVANSGAASSPNDTYWSISKMTFPPGVTVPTENPHFDTNLNASGVIVTPVNKGRPCAYYVSTGAQNCGLESTYEGTQGFAPGTISLGNKTAIIGDYEAGTRVCYVLGVYPRKNQGTDASLTWTYTAPQCVIITKKPKIQILGGDLFVGRAGTSNIITSTGAKSVNGTSRIFGSWGEYGVFASGDVKGFGSGAGYSGGATSAAQCDVQLLTFTNAGGASTCSNSTPKGGYAVGSLLPAIGERLTATSVLPAAPVDLQNISKGSYSSSSQVTLTNGNANASVGMNIAKAKWVVINAPTQTVTIKNNIIYSGDTIEAIGDIPQVVIIANQINIDAGVTQVDAWLIASGANGTINTCSEITDPASQLNAGRCNQQLRVNGPVVARKLLLYRTYGSGTGLDTGTPAEIFNFRPDAYLWATSYSLSSGRLQTASSKELPPRF